ERLLATAVLGNGQRARRRQEPGAEHVERGNRQVLELVSGDVDLRAERAQCFEVIVIRARPKRRDVRRRRVVVRVENVGPIAKLRRRDREHPAELAAANDPDRGARGNRHRGASATDPVCASLQAWSRWPSDSSAVASIAAARSAALIAPALPMASVPTGTPAGIWTIESRLSMPFNAWVSIGTPSTGSAVIEAVIPGKCAAPPAPAITTLRPRSFAEWA